MQLTQRSNEVIYAHAHEGVEKGGFRDGMTA